MAERRTRAASSLHESLASQRGPIPSALQSGQTAHDRARAAGVDIIANGSGSHHQLRKLDQRLDLMRSATTKAGGVYLYANQQGCDGGRVYYDGCASVLVNGKLVKQASQFSLKVRRPAAGAWPAASISPATEHAMLRRAAHIICARNLNLLVAIRLPAVCAAAPQCPHIHTGRGDHHSNG